MYKIEQKEVPEGRRNRKYPLREMEVGDTFDVPLEGKDVYRIRPAILVAARQMFPERQYTTHYLKKENILRCKRLK